MKIAINPAFGSCSTTKSQDATTVITNKNNSDNKQLITPPDILTMEFNGGIYDEHSDANNPVKPFLNKINSILSSPAKAVVLKLTSGGGELGTAEELANAVQTIKKSGKKVIVSVAQMAASGGVLFAMPANYIISNTLAQWGTLGVIHERPVSLQEGLKSFFGFKDIQIASKGSKLKCLGKDRLLEERRHYLKTGQQGPVTQRLQEYLNTQANSFKHLILSYRHASNTLQSKKLTPEVLDNLMDGRLLTATQALEVGLIDEIGDTQKAIEKAKELIGKPNAIVSEI